MSSSTEYQYRHCGVCDRDTPHTVMRNGSGDIIASACRDPEHPVLLAVQQIRFALAGGGQLSSAELRSPPFAELDPGAIEQAVARLEADEEIIVLRETSDQSSPFTFSGLLANR